MGACKSLCATETQPETPAFDAVSVSAAQPQKARVERKATTVGCRIALKAPHGTAMQALQNGQWVPGADINVWLQSLFEGQTWTHWLFYNDEVEGHQVSATHGHCKGIVAWNERHVAWLIHSVPKFPAAFDGQRLAPIAAAELKYGQSFLLVEHIPRAHLDGILGQLQIMHAYVYGSRGSIEWPEPPAMALRELVLDDRLIHVAKSRKWGADLYEHHLAVRFEATWRCETWIRGDACPPSTRVQDVREITWPSQRRYAQTHDHSKYACSNAGHTIIGDLNRMTSQSRRGGGGMVLVDPTTAAQFAALMAAPT